MKHIKFLSILFAVSVIFFGVVFVTSNDRVTPATEAINGIWDLSDWNFKDDGPVVLSGKWEFYFNEFLTHEDFENGREGDPIYVDIPSTQITMEDIKPFDETRFYGTMRLVVKLPEDAEIYGIRSHIVLSAYKLFINGRFIEEVGKVGVDEATSAPYYKVLYNYVSPENHQLELIYQTSDFFFDDCAILAPEIGYAHHISEMSRIKASEGLFLFGMLLTMGLYHLGLYFSRKKDRATLYFGVFCLMFALRMVVVGEKILPSIIEFNYLFYAKLAYVTVYGGFYALCAFMYFSFPKLLNERFYKIGSVVSIMITLVTIFLPFKYIYPIFLGYAVVGFSLLAYIVVMLITGMRRKIQFTGIVLIGCVSIIVAFLNDYIYELTFKNHASMIPAGIAVFILTQAYTLSTKFSNAFSEVESLSEENEIILGELRNVNLNLESIVESRTKELRNALEEMDIMSKTDYLTKLPNRRMMFQKISELQMAKKAFYVAIADIDKFKIVNDTYGHDKGDIVLKDLSERLIESVGEDGIVGRWGGEEFMLILYGNSDVSILKKADEIREFISSKYNIAIHAAITVTIGLCEYIPESSIDVCIANADKALYEGKINGRNQCRVYKI